MAFIILSILFNTILFVIIKQFAKYKIDNLQALVVNYLVAGTLGIIINGQTLSLTKITQYKWFPGSLSLGFLFIIVFYLTTLAAQKNGLSVTTIASKMSIVIPIFFGVLLYNDAMGSIKTIGIALALVAVYLSSKKGNEKSFDRTKILLPLLVFIGAGSIDTSIKYLQDTYVETKDVSLFSINCFFSAFLAGSIIIIYKVINRTTKIELKNVLAGIVLGIPNYFSLFYMVKMLDSKTYDSATIFTIHNVSIVILSTIFAILLFKEEITTKNYFGIALAIVALLMVTY